MRCFVGFQHGFVPDHVLFREISQRDHLAVHAHCLQRHVGRANQSIRDWGTRAPWFLPDPVCNCGNPHLPSHCNQKFLLQSQEDDLMTALVGSLITALLSAALIAAALIAALSTLSTRSTLSTFFH
jgi:hypothetical protein